MDKLDKLNKEHEQNEIQVDNEIHSKEIDDNNNSKGNNLLSFLMTSIFSLGYIGFFFYVSFTPSSGLGGFMNGILYACIIVGLFPFFLSSLILTFVFGRRLLLEHKNKDK